MKIINNILYGVGTSKPLTQTGSSNLVVSNNIFYDGSIPSSVAGGNTNANPGFASASTGDFQLQTGSPAIDKANSQYTVTTDLLGHQRPVGNGYDMGCYEYAGVVAPPPPAFPSAFPSASDTISLI